MKNRLSEVCDGIAKSGEPVTVTRRGKPLVRIIPVEYTGRPRSVWDTVKESRERYGPLTEDFELPERTISENRPDPFDDMP